MINNKIKAIIIPYVKYLWGLHWIFRVINPFTILYFTIGPALIWHAKPSMSPYKRYALFATAFVLSCFIYVLDIQYMRSLRWFEYHLCADQLDIPFHQKQEICNYPYKIRHQDEQKYSTEHEISTNFFELSMILLLVLSSPFWGGVRLEWRIYHKKTIKAMGDKFRWKKFDNITIFLSLIWFSLSFFMVILPCLIFRYLFY